MRVAAVDCGTNSIRLLIADIEGNSFREVLRTMEIVRLGQGVDETGQFHPDAITRTLAAVDKFAAEIAKRGVEKFVFVQQVPHVMQLIAISLLMEYVSDLELNLK